MKKKKKRKLDLKKRVKICEVYIDDQEDFDLLTRKLTAAMKEINPKAERLILVLMDELKYPEQEEGIT